MREGRTLTRTIEIETRQHELMGVDLGEGIPRRAMLWGAASITVWCVPLGLIFGAPRPATLPLWLLPPVLLAVYGWRESPSNPRRRRVTEWVLAVRWVLTGHRPVVALGRQRGRQGRTRSIAARISARYAGGDLLALLMPWRLQPVTGSEAAGLVPPARAGRAIRLGGTVQLIGNDEAQRGVRRLGRRTRRTADSGPANAPISTTSAPSMTSSTTSSTTSSSTTAGAARRRRRSARRGRTG